MRTLEIGYWVFIASLSIPFQWIDYWRVGGLPGFNVVYVMFLLTATTVGFRKLLRPDVITVIGFIGFLTLNGLVNARESFWSTKFFFTDLAYVSALIAGRIITQQFGALESAKLFSKTYVAATVALTTLGLMIRFNFISTTGATGRAFDPAQYSVHYLVLATMPFALYKYRNNARFYVYLLIGTLSCLEFSISSGTRSALIATIVVAVGCAVAKTIRGLIGGLSAVTLAVVISIIVGNIDIGRSLSAIGVVGERLQSESLVGDSRITELEAMLDQLQGNYLIGKGMGAGFLSPIIVVSEQEDRGIAPHIGILTWLLKGGVFAQVCFLVWLVILVKKTFATKPFAVWLSLPVLHYTLIAGLSGGYGYVPFFVLGAAWGLATLRAQGHTAHSRNKHYAPSPESHVCLAPAAR